MNSIHTEVTKGLYLHFKGGVYFVMGIALDSETDEEKVIYCSANGQFFIRSMKVFLENVEVKGYHMPRFTYLGSTPGFFVPNLIETSGIKS